jgi:hypothetical protein
MRLTTLARVTRPVRHCLLLALLLAGTIAGAGRVHSVLARSHSATPYTCPWPSAQYALTCYPPNQKREAEALLRRPPMDPSAAVRQVTGLPLTLITAARRTLPTPSRRVNLLSFDYGNVPQNTDFPDPSVPVVPWVLVTETAGPGKGVKGMQLTRGYECTGSTTGGTTRCAFGYWTLAEDLPARRLFVGITSSLSKATLRRIGQALSGAAPSGWVQVTATGHGVRLTLSIRRRSYPQNALVAVWGRAENITAHTVKLYDPGPHEAGQYIPQVVVLAKRGGEPLPVSLNDYMPNPGPVSGALPLYPHQTRNLRELVILRGPYLRLDLTFTGRPMPPQNGPTLSTPLLHLSLTAPDTPTVALHVLPDPPSADIAPAGTVRGKLMAVWYYNCDPAYDEEVQENIDWSAIGSHVTPACPSGFSLVGWHEDAGWLNHSVAQIDWGEP